MQSLTKKLTKDVDLSLEKLNSSSAKTTRLGYAVKKSFDEWETPVWHPPMYHTIDNKCFTKFNFFEIFFNNHHYRIKRERKADWIRELFEPSACLLNRGFTLLIHFCFWISKLLYLDCQILLSTEDVSSRPGRSFKTFRGTAQNCARQTINHAASRIKQAQLQLCG